MFGNFITLCKQQTFSNYNKDVILMHCKYNSHSFCEECYDFLPFSEPVHIKNSVVKRRSDFLAGRITAMFALEKIGIKNTSVPIGNNRMPIFPEGCVGSITHTCERAFVAVSKKENTSLIGIDCENFFPSLFARNISLEILLDSEMKNFNKMKINFSLYCTIVFSAKESLFKTLYPVVGVFFGFKSAQVEINSDISGFKIKVIHPLGNFKGVEFYGNIEIFSDSVLTIITSSNTFESPLLLNY